MRLEQVTPLGHISRASCDRLSAHPVSGFMVKVSSLQLAQGLFASSRLASPALRPCEIGNRPVGMRRPHKLLVGGLSLRPSASAPGSAAIGRRRGLGRLAESWGMCEDLESVHPVISSYFFIASFELKVKS